MLWTWLSRSPVSMAMLRREVFPEFQLEIILVTVPYPGASPEEVEQGIVLAVEEAINGVEGVDEIRSTASEGRGLVIAELMEGADIQQANQDIQQEVLGWVYLGLNRHSLADRERAILLTSLGVAGVVLSLSILLALGISSSVSVPVRRLTDTLLRLRRGELDVVVPEDSGGELGTLEAGFNRNLVEKLVKTSHDLHASGEMEALGEPVGEDEPSDPGNAGDNRLETTGKDST